MIDLLDAGHRRPHHIGIQHRALDIVHRGQRRGRKQNIEHAYPMPASRKLRDQILSDKAAAPGYEYACHGRLFDSLRCPSWRNEMLGAEDGLMMVARSSRNPSAMNNFAITNIGPSSRCVGLSAIAGWRRSKIRWPMICEATPRAISTAVDSHTTNALELSTIRAAKPSSAAAATVI